MWNRKFQILVQGYIIKMIKELLEDNKFKNGFKIRYPYHVLNDDDNPEFIYQTNQEVPSWYLSQWFSTDTLAKGTISNEQGIINLADKTKKVSVKNSQIYLEINGGLEYQKPRRADEPWPHLLLEQIFKNKMLNEYDQMKMIINFDYLKFINHMNDDFNPEIHTAQFQWFINIGNQNPKSKGYKDFFWFGLSFLDTPRYDFPPGFMAIDGGKEDATKKFIYIVDSRNYLKKSVNIGDQASISVEIMDLLRGGFVEAKKGGFLKETNFEDLGLNSTNIGFEITGTFDIGLKINKISLEVNKKEVNG